VSDRLIEMKMAMSVKLHSWWYKATNRCGAIEGLYGACNRKRGHMDSPVGMAGEAYRMWHAEYRRNSLWCEWPGT
jgi:hypothetical protein